MAETVKASRSLSIWPSSSIWPSWRAIIPASEAGRVDRSGAGRPPEAAEPQDRGLTAPELIRLARSARSVRSG